MVFKGNYNTCSGGISVELKIIQNIHTMEDIILHELDMKWKMHSIGKLQVQMAFTI